MSSVNSVAPLTILHVDDNEMNRYVVSKTLRSAGFEVIEAVSGRQALELAAQRPAAILLDVNLPDVNGFEVCRILKADPDLCVIPVIHLTASYANSLSKVTALEGGADGYLFRPVEPRELIATIHSVLRMREAATVARRMSEEWQATFDAIEDAACLVNGVGEVLRFNRGMAQLLQKPLEEVRGCQLDAVLGPVIGPVGAAATADAQQGPLPGRVTREQAAGGRWYRITADPVPPTAGSDARTVYIVADITERMLATQELAASYARIEELNARLRRGMRETHHRVKNNLQVIAAIVDLQTLEETETVPSTELARLSAHIKTLAAVHDLLTERATDENAPEWVSARAILERLLPHLQQTAAGRALRYDLDDAHLTVRQGTSLALLTNELVNNALKHGQGALQIDFQVDGSVAHLIVCDDGPGFGPDFDPRTDANTGLDLVNNLSEWDLGGSVAYANRPTGGACVTITMPITPIGS